MLNRPYAVDAVSQSEDLATKILASSSPSQISSSCASITSFLRSCPPDQCRHFFSLAFPSLICKVFGFGESPSHPPASRSNSRGWIDVVNLTNDSNLTSALFSLLSPTGVLFQSIFATDRRFPVKYLFPTERLPEWSRLMLANESHVQALNLLCPFLKNRIVESLTKNPSSFQVQLNIFEYYVFWFAYYPIYKGSDHTSAVASVKKSTRFTLENWMISHLPTTKTEGLKRGCNLYLLLFYAYLRDFVPLENIRADFEVYRCSLLHYDSEDGGGLFQERAEFFVDVLVNYWLIDNDFSPLPTAIAKSYRLVPSGQSETPPSLNVSKIVKLLVEYMIFCSVARKEIADSITASRQEWALSPTNPVSLYGSHLCGSLNLCFRRAIYRYVLRALLFCPVGDSVKNVLEVFSVWITFIEPWKIEEDAFVELDSLVHDSGKISKSTDVKYAKCNYSGVWESYVLSNYLFYTSLVMHFFGFSHKFLNTDPHAILQMLHKIVDILTSSNELVDLLKKMDSSFHLKQSGSSKSLFSSFYKYDPLIREQLQDWEDGLSETDADGSFLHNNWNKNFKLFSDGEDGGQQLIKLFIMRAEVVLQTGCGLGMAENLQRLDSLKAKTSFLLGANAVWSPRSALQNRQETLFRDDLFTPTKVRVPGALDAKYNGDQMKRPFSDDEIRWLAKLLLKLSSFLNEILGLNRAVSDNANQKKEPYVDISTSVANVSGTKNTSKVILLGVWSWCLMLLTSLLNWMRINGLRINLRVLASKKLVVGLIVVFFVATFLKSSLQLAFGVLVQR